MLGDAYTSDDKTRISNALIVGQIFGILLLGFVTDWWSRTAGMVFTSSLVVVGSLMATVALRVEHLGVENMLWYSQSCVAWLVSEWVASFLLVLL